MKQSIAKKQIAKLLNKMPEVKWDRYVHYRKTEYVFFGWIDRDKDTYKDFFVLFITTKEGKADAYTYVISSAKLTKKVSPRYGFPTTEHEDCIRVESLFSNNEVNTIKL